MDLTSRKAVHDGMTKYGFVAPDMTVHEFVEDELPSVPAVPLDKLCEWLEVNARTPIYNLQHTAEWWKESLTMWMEEENHAEK